jgi:O-antigen/teichoic acid export membrane protein
MQSLQNAVSRLTYSIERLLKLDISYLLSGGLWTSLSFAVGVLGSLATMVAFGNLLPREAYGIYNYLLSLGASLSFLTLSGTGPAVMRAVARGYESVVLVAFKFQLKYNFIAVATILAAAFYYGYKGNTLFAWSLALLAFAYPLAEAFHIYKQILTGRRRFDTLTKITNIVTLIGVFITVGALLYTDNVLILIVIYTSMSLVPNIIAYRMVTRNIDKRRPEPEQIKEMKRTAFHLTGAGVIGIIASYIDRIVLFQVAGPVALAVYSFALAGPDRLKSLIKNWMSIALPNLTRRSIAQIRQVLYRRIGLSILVGSAVFLAYFFIAPVLFKIFLPRYLDAIAYSQIIAAGLITTPVSVYIGSIFSSQNMIRAMYALNFGNHISRIVLFVTLGWLWQIWGLVVALIASQAINAVISIIIWEIESRRLIKINELE